MLFWFILMLCLVIVIGSGSVLYELINFFYHEVSGWYNGSVRPVKTTYKQILNKHFDYYKDLSPQDKKKFERRLQKFIYSKEFISRGVTYVTEKMVVMISAVAVKITFGLPEIYLTNFKRILIYPDAYYSNISRRYHLGEVNPRMGVIVLSWKSFLHGYAVDDDSENVGIHEMAHALHFENRIKNEEYGFLDEYHLNQLEAITEREITKINTEDNHFFRDYAGTNEYEFFAVALEYFFEQPLEFSQNMPDLYQTLKALLNQDPLRK